MRKFFVVFGVLIIALQGAQFLVLYGIEKNIRDSRNQLQRLNNRLAALDVSTVGKRTDPSRGDAPRASASLLRIAPEDILHNVVEGKIYVALNLYPNAPTLENMPKAKAESGLRLLAHRISKYLWNQPNYQWCRVAYVEMFYITSLNEYNNPDYSDIIRHGSLTYRKDSTGKVMLSIGKNFHFQQGKVDLKKAPKREGPFIDLDSLEPRQGRNTKEQNGKPELRSEYHLGAVERPATGDAIAEQLIYDEMDFYDHSAYLADTYPSFSPERIRKNGCQYYFRRNRFEAFSGDMFGEVSLGAEAGSVIYLPRRIRKKNLVAIKIHYRKTDPTGRFFFRFYDDVLHRAEFVEGKADGFAMRANTKWNTITIPVRALTFRGFWEEVPKKMRDFHPLYNLWYYRYDPGRDMICGFELGMCDSRPGETVYIDRISLVRNATASQKVSGEVSPVVEGLDVILRTPEKTLVSRTNKRGEFAFALPEHTTRFELAARYDNIWHLPREGRYFEVGSYLPRLHIDLSNEPPEAFAGVHRPSPWDYKHTQLGMHYLARSYITFSEPKHQEFLTECQVNNFGYRDKSRRYGNQDAQYRVVILGGCHIDGRQVDSMDHVANQLEAIGRFHRVPIECIPIGFNTQILTGHWTTIQEHVYRFKPNVIVFYLPFLRSLRMTDVQFFASIRGFDPEHPWADFFKLDPQGNLVHIPYDGKWIAYRRNAPEGISLDEQRRLLEEISIEICRVDPENMSPECRRILDTFEKALAFIARDAKKHGARVALGLNLLRGNVQNEVRVVEGVRAQDSNAMPRMMKLARRAGVEPWNLMCVTREKAYDGNGKHIRAWRYAGHLSPAGHRYSAESIADILSRDLAFGSWLKERGINHALPRMGLLTEDDVPCLPFAIEKALQDDESRIMGVVRDFREPEVILRKVEPFCRHWAKEFVDWLCSFRDAGYRFKSLNDAGKADVGEPVVFLRHDVHYWDIPSAIVMACLEEKLGVVADFHISWNLFELDRHSRLNYLLLKELNSDYIRFAYHGSPVLSLLLDHRFKGDSASLNRWRQSKRFEAFLDRLARVEPNAGTRVSMAYSDLLTRAEKRLKTSLREFLTYFPDTCTASSHGNPINQRTSTYCLAKGAKYDKVRDLLVSFNFLNTARVRKFGYRWEHMTFFKRNPRVIYIRDDSSAQFNRDVAEAMRERKTLLLLLHSANLQRRKIQLRRVSVP